MTRYSEQVANYLRQDVAKPLFLQGDSLSVLGEFPDECVDCAMTSPPYWGQRVYDSGGIGLEDSYQDYLSNLLSITSEVRRVLKPTGSFWLNLGDGYHKKCQIGLPWRVALAMTDDQSWILRNDVVWNKIKGGMDNTKDKLRNVHEMLFHFVKSTKYYYDDSAIRKTPGKSKVVKGSVVSATGVSGVRYRRQLELSTVLSVSQKEAAFSALDEILDQVREGELSDFRMIIRGQQRTTHSNSASVSGRARELNEKGFYFLKYHPKGAKLGDVWDILPEDTQKRKHHFAPFPPDLCRTPILASCPPDGIVLDPFSRDGNNERRRKPTESSIHRHRSLGGLFADRSVSLLKAWTVKAVPVKAVPVKAVPVKAVPVKAVQFSSWATSTSATTGVLPRRLFHQANRSTRGRHPF